MYLVIRCVLLVLTIITALFAFGAIPIPAPSIALFLFLTFLFLLGVVAFTGPHHIPFHWPHRRHRHP
jgi:uncharacterized membrane protein YtjA (UPF0391 family)